MRRLLLIPSVAVLAACTGPSATATAARGLPQQLVPADIDSPQYEPPRHRCAPALRDRARPDVQLTLEHARIRVDRERSMEGGGMKTVASRVPEGDYRVSPDTAYGLEPRQLLRVDCGSQTAVTVLEPAA